MRFLPSSSSVVRCRQFWGIAMDKAMTLSPCSCPCSSPWFGLPAFSLAVASSSVVAPVWTRDKDCPRSGRLERNESSLSRRSGANGAAVDVFSSAWGCRRHEQQEQQQQQKCQRRYLHSTLFVRSDGGAPHLIGGTYNLVVVAAAKRSCSPLRGDNCALLLLPPESVRRAWGAATLSSSPPKSCSPFVVAPFVAKAATIKMRTKDGPMFPTPPLSKTIHHRYLSSSPTNRSGRHLGRDKSKGPVTNELLVMELLRKAGGMSVDALHVRLVIDRGVGNPPDIDIVPLSEAIACANDMDVDLVGVSIDQDVPVIKATNLKRMGYDQSKRKAAASAAAGGGPSSVAISKQVKEFKFKAGIENNDLQRKVDKLIKYIEKGHTCKITITSSTRNLRMDKDAVANTLDRVREIVGDRVIEPREMRGNEMGNHASIMFQPNSKAISK